MLPPPPSFIPGVTFFIALAAAVTSTSRLAVHAVSSSPRTCPEALLTRTSMRPSALCEFSRNLSRASLSETLQASA